MNGAPLVFECVECTKKMPTQTVIGTYPLSYPLRTFCEDCYKKICEKK